MTPSTKQCPLCDAEFTCDPEQEAASCWCNRYPAIMPVENAHDCHCPNCLAMLAGETINNHLDTLSHETALILASGYRNDGVLIENIDYTIDAGNLVFSCWYHLKRGTCCGNGCRHCPYN